jgi:hypothetical protein
MCVLSHQQHHQQQQQRRQQWVTFMLLFQAGTFLFPYKVWKAIEGGLIASFGDDAR